MKACQRMRASATHQEMMTCSIHHVTCSAIQGTCHVMSCDIMSCSTGCRGAYDDEVLVYDIEEDGSIGTQPLMATVSVDEEPDNFTCPLPFSQY